MIPKASTGNKTCQVIEIPLKPLNLHERINDLDNETSAEIPFSKIKITGKFSLSDAHHWVSNCLPDFPPNVSHEEEE